MPQKTHIYPPGCHTAGTLAAQGYAGSGGDANFWLRHVPRPSRAHARHVFFKERRYLSLKKKKRLTVARWICVLHVFASQRWLRVIWGVIPKVVPVPILGHWLATHRPPGPAAGHRDRLQTDGEPASALRAPRELHRNNFKSFFPLSLFILYFIMIEYSFLQGFLQVFFRFSLGFLRVFS